MEAAVRYAGSVAEGFRIEVPQVTSNKIKPSTFTDRGKSFSSLHLLQSFATKVESYGKRGWEPSPAVFVERTGEKYKVKYFRYSSGKTIADFPNEGVFTDLMFPVEQEMTHGAVDMLVRELKNNGIGVKLPDGYEPAKPAHYKDSGLSQPKIIQPATNKKSLEIKGVSKHADGVYEVDTSDTFGLNDYFLQNTPVLARKARNISTGDEATVWLERTNNHVMVRFIAIGVRDDEPYLYERELARHFVISLRNGLLRNGLKTSSWIGEYLQYR